MSTSRRKRRKNNQGLKLLIGILSVILVAVLIIAISIGGDEGGDTLQTDHTTTAPSTTVPSTTQEAENTTLPTETAITGWYKDGDDLYYYGSDGVMRTGITEVDGKLYCFSDNGALCAPGWQKISGKTYYVNADGSPYTGWLELENALYYLKEDGTMARGQVEIDGEIWFFTSTGAQIYVVNPWHYVPSDYEVNLVKLPDSIGTNRYVADYIYEPLMEMLSACKAAMQAQYGGTGEAVPDVWVRSANRTNADQNYLFENKVQRVLADNPGYTRAQAEAEAATVVAVPGTSEHQLGLAVDIVDTQINALVEEQEDLPAQQWLMEHCWEYGFILRYPKGTTDVTGIIYEPWHYRYVGLELAAELHELDVTLEEYIESLTE